MSASERLGFDAYFVLPAVQIEGADPLPIRPQWNFTSTVSVPTDDDPNNVTKIPLGTGGGGSLSVTGTGFPAFIGGTLQPAAKLVANGDVSSVANIDVTKLSLGGADGNCLRRASGANGWGQLDLSNTNAVTGLGTTGELLFANSAVGSAAHASYDATLGLSLGLPLGGDTSAPFRWRTVTLTAAGGTVNLSAAQAACVEMIVSGTTSTTFVFPTSNNGEHHYIRNGLGASTWAATGQSGTGFNSSLPSGWIYFNGTDYKKEGT